MVLRVAFIAAIKHFIVEISSEFSKETNFYF